jgi:hypothetical protein
MALQLNDRNLEAFGAAMLHQMGVDTNVKKRVFSVWLMILEAEEMRLEMKIWCNEMDVVWQLIIAESLIALTEAQGHQMTAGLKTNVRLMVENAIKTLEENNENLQLAYEVADAFEFNKKREDWGVRWQGK